MSRKITVLFDAHALLGQKTGVGYYTENLIQELANQHPDSLELVGYYHNFLYRKQITDLPTGPNIRYRRIAFIPGQIVNLLRRFRILLPIELLTLTKADFILYPNYLGLVSVFKTPSASVIHDLTFIDLPEYVSKRNLHDLQRFIPAQIRRSAFLITVSEFSKQRISEEFHVPVQNILVTPIPPATPQVANVTSEQQAISALGIAGKFILTLGTVEPRKNLPNMLDAYLQLPEELQREYAFVVAGKIGWNCDAEVARLAELKAQGKNVIHLGYVSDKQRSALYRHASLFTTASFYEGFGMPALEAMSYGTPCAMSDIPVFREVAGEAALYFNQDDVTSITDTWKQLLGDSKLRQQLANKGKQQANSYSWPRVADTLYQHILEVTSREKHS